jgi:putative membrane protein
MRSVSGWVLRWILNFAAILVVAWILTGFWLGIWGAIVGCGFLGLLNAFIRPILGFVWPRFDWRSLGITTVVVNLLGMALTTITIKGVDVANVGSLLLTVVMISLFSFIISSLVDRLFYHI